MNYLIIAFIAFFAFRLVVTIGLSVIEGMILNQIQMAMPTVHGQHANQVQENYGHKPLVGFVSHNNTKINVTSEIINQNEPYEKEEDFVAVVSPYSDETPTIIEFKKVNGVFYMP